MIVPVVVTLLATAVNPCVLLEARDIARVLGWSVAAGTVRAYRLPGGAGKMCTFEGRDGTVLVTVPSKGTGLPVNDLTSDLGAARTPLHDVRSGCAGGTRARFGDRPSSAGATMASACSPSMRNSPMRCKCVSSSGRSSHICRGTDKDGLLHRCTRPSRPHP